MAQNAKPKGLFIPRSWVLSKLQVVPPHGPPCPLMLLLCARWPTRTSQKLREHRLSSTISSLQERCFPTFLFG